MTTTTRITTAMAGWLGVGGKNLMDDVKELRAENERLRELNAHLLANAEYSDVVKDGFLHIYKGGKLVGVTHLDTLTG